MAAMVQAGQTPSESVSIAPLFTGDLRNQYLTGEGERQLDDTLRRFAPLLS